MYTDNRPPLAPANAGGSDLYGRVLHHALLPAWEKLVRKRPTLDHLASLTRSQWLSYDALLELQSRELRALIAHAYAHTDYYRRLFDEAGLTPDDIAGPTDLARLPLLTREQARTSIDARTSKAPPLVAIHKTTSGTLGQPLAFGYNIESEYWRNAVRMRGYAWAGYEVGAKSLHYWGFGTTEPTWKRKAKITLDRAIKRESYYDCTVRSDAAMAEVVAAIKQKKPDVIVTYAQAGGDLARYVLRTNQRSWGTIPVICGAERLYPHDREALEAAFGPAVFETYGCREFMLMATECEAHDGLHVQMENVIVEVVVTEGDRVRAAEPGEVGDVVVTDLHNLGMPFIRYANGDRAIARAPDTCACGRQLPRIESIEGRVTETLRDGDGNPVSGLVFNILFCDLAEATREFQAVQHKSGDITLKLVPAGELTDETLGHLTALCEKYLPGVDVATEICDEIPLTHAGKRKVVVVEQ